MKTNKTFIALFCLGCSTLYSQQILTSDLANKYFPAHAGDKWQYRSKYTGEITLQRFIDSLSTDSAGNMFIWGRSGSGQLSAYNSKMDTSFNVYNLSFQPSFPRYKLFADSGQSWVAGISNSDTTMVSVSNVLTEPVFNKIVTIKVFQFNIDHDSESIFWIGNDYLAEGFGLIQMDVEPSEVYLLTGAVIDGIQYGEAILSVKQEDTIVPRFALLQNYPNPFNPATVITYALSTKSHVKVKIFNSLGQQVLVIVDENKNAGTYSIQWAPKSLSSGTYFCCLEIDGSQLIRKMLYIK